MSKVKLTRRQALQSWGAAIAAGPGTSDHVDRPRRTLVCVCLRGALDGLSAVVPYAEEDYYRNRRTIAVPHPDEKNGVLPLDSRFGLHPQLQPLVPLYQAGKLAIINAVGSPHPTRSHFEAQDYLETGIPGNALAEGWLNRYLAQSPDRSNPLRAVALSDTVPRALHGREPVLAFDSVSSFGLNTGKRHMTLLDDFQRLYANHDDALGQAARDALATVSDVRAKTGDSYTPEHGVTYPHTPAGQRLMDVVRLIKAGYNLEIAWVDVGGWDTHTGQRGPKSQLAKQLSNLAAGLHAFYTDMGPLMHDTVLVTMTEFGRMVAENGIGGTDHGHGSLMFVLGDRVHGGRICGEWPGLAVSDRYRGRDLAVTTDFREGLGELAVKLLECKDLESVFPGFDYTGKLRLLDAD